MSADVHIRELLTMEDLRATVELQQAIWGMKPYESASPFTLNAVIHNGGNVLGAEIDGQLVGFTFAFPAKRDPELWLWSHMTGVRPGLQGKQIGYKLKQMQRLWALDNGYEIIGWTFDPMQRGNANFNFNQLGSFSKTYYVNHYGAMTDGINAGLASDRLEAVWYLNDPQVVQRARGNFQADDLGDLSHEAFLVTIDENNTIQSHLPLTLNLDRYYIEIPYSIATLKQSNMELAKQWQLHVRNAITTLLAQGFVVSHFINNNNRYYYVMGKQSKITGN